MEVNQIQTKTRVIIVAAIILIIGIVMGIVTIYSPLNRFKHAIEEEDFLTASKVYVEMSASEKSDALEEVDSWLSDLLEKYDNGKLDEEMTWKLLDSIVYHFTKFYDFVEGGYIEFYENELNILSVSKKHFSDAQEAENMGDLLSAIESYGYVAPQDSNYEMAQEKVESLLEQHKANTLQQAKAMMEEKDYEGALMVLYDSINIHNGDKELKQLIVDCTQKEHEQIAENSLNEAADAVSGGDYPTAIRILEEVSDLEIESVVEKLSEYRENYLQETLIKAEEQAKNGTYEEAVLTLNSAMAILGEDEVLLSKIEEYKSKYPAKLVDLTPSEGKSRAAKYENADIYGNEFHEGLEIPGLHGTEIIEYVANQSYARFTAKVLIAKRSDDLYKTNLKIYADDVLKLDTGWLNKKSQPIDVDIDISGATFVRLEIESSTVNLNTGVLLIEEPTFRN